jgi:hypothetical protein
MQIANIPPEIIVIIALANEKDNLSSISILLRNV